MATGEVNAVSIPVSISAKSHPPGLMTGWITELLRREGSVKMSSLTLVHNGVWKIPLADKREDNSLATTNLQVMWPLSTTDVAPGIMVPQTVAGNDGKEKVTGKKLPANSFQNFIMHIYLRSCFIRHMCLYAHNSHGQSYGYYLKKRARADLKVLDRHTEVQSIVPPVGFRDEFTERGAERSCDMGWYSKAMDEYTEMVADAYKTYARKIRSIDPWFIGQCFVRPEDVFGDEPNIGEIAMTPSMYFKTDNSHVFRAKERHAKLADLGSILRAMKVTFAALDLWAFREGVYPAKCWVGMDVLPPGDTPVPRNTRDWNRAIQLMRRAKFVKNPSERLSEEESWELNSLMNPEDIGDAYYTNAVCLKAWENFVDLAREHHLTFSSTAKQVFAKNRQRTLLDDIAFVEVLLHELAGMREPSRDVEVIKPIIHQKVAEHFGLNYSQADRNPWDLRNPHNKNRFDCFVESLVTLRDEEGSQFAEVEARRVSLNALAITRKLEGIFEPTLKGVGSTEQYYPSPNNTYRVEDQCFIPMPGPVFAGRVVDDRRAPAVANLLEEPVTLEKTYSVTRVGITRGELDPDSSLVANTPSSGAVDDMLMLAPQVDSYMVQRESGTRIITTWVYPIDKQTFPYNPKLDENIDPSRLLDEDVWEDKDYAREDYLRRNRWLANFLINGEITGKYNKIIDGIRPSPDVVLIKHTNRYLEDYVKLYGDESDVVAPFGVQVPNIGIPHATIIEMNDKVTSPGEERKGMERKYIDDGASGIDQNEGRETKLIAEDGSTVMLSESELERRIRDAVQMIKLGKESEKKEEPRQQATKARQSKATNSGSRGAGSLSYDKGSDRKDNPKSRRK